MIAYYEVFHERLAGLTLGELEGFTTDSWNSRHPIRTPYFEEFRPLLRSDGGVVNYQREMASLRFVPEGGLDGRLSEPEITYLRSLVAFASGVQKVPVLTCSRSLGRIAGAKAALGGVHVLLVRALFNQWCSYVSYVNEGTYYFINATLALLCNNRHDPFVDYLFQRYVSTEACRGNVFVARFISSETFLLAFLGLHLYLYMSAHRHADVIVDVSQLAAEPAAAAAMEAKLAEMTGLTLVLRDAVDRRTAIPPLQDAYAQARAEGWQLLERAAAVQDVSHSAAGFGFAVALFEDFLRATAPPSPARQPGPHG